MDVIADARAIRSRVVPTKNLKILPLPQGDLHQERNDVSLRGVVFAAFLGCSSRIKVAQCGIPQSLGYLQPMQYPLHEILGFPIRAAWHDPLVLGDRNCLRIVEKVGRGRYHDSTNAKFQHHLGEIESVPYVVTKIQEWLFHRFPHQGVGGKVKHPSKFVSPE